MADPRRVEAAVAAAEELLRISADPRHPDVCDVKMAIAAALRAYDEWAAPTGPLCWCDTPATIAVQFAGAALAVWRCDAHKDLAPPPRQQP